ncbi:MAG: hypothetical protein WCJ30_12800 [Deltaproteobacteria bacterium]
MFALGGTVRIGADRFELSFWDLMPLVCALGVLVPASVWILGWRWGGLALIASLGVCLTARVRLVVDRETSWVEHRVAGLRWRRVPCGRAPTVDDFGYDWSEIAVVPTVPELRARLQNGLDRMVLVEWDWNQPAKDADAAVLVALTRGEIQRLHRETADQPG